MSPGPARAHSVLALRPGLPDRDLALAAASINGHAVPDILVVNFEAGDLSLYQEDNAGGYVERNPSPFLVPEGPSRIVTTSATASGQSPPLDINGDHLTDVVIVSRLSHIVSIRLSDATLVLKATANLIVGEVPRDAVLADFTSDGKLDLAITCEASNVIYLYGGKGDGTFVFIRTLDARTTEQKNGSVDVGPYGIAAADFNRDGRMDLVVSQRNTDQLALFLGNGNGTFSAPVTIPAGRHPTFLHTARFNDDQSPGESDDFPDLAVLLEGGKQNPDDPLEAPLPGGVAVLLGNGNGTFTAAPSLTVGLSDTPFDLAVGRIGLGAAGFDDVALANFGSSTLFLYPATGVGGFASPLTLGGPGSTLRSPDGIALLDRNGDGLVDRIAASNFDGYSFTLFDGGGGTPFTENPQSPRTATPNPVSLSAGELESGVGTDLAILAGGDPKVQTYIAVNDGFFFKHEGTPLPAGSLPTSLLLQDLDRDHVLDVVAGLADSDGSAGSGTAPGLVMLKGSGNATFGSVSGLCTGGTSPGTSCHADASCPGGGTCSYSPEFGTCAAGTNAGKTCAANADCPSSTCAFSTLFRTCAGGSKAGAICGADSGCPGSTCGPPGVIPLQGAATAMVSSDLNPLDDDLDGIPNAVDNCPARYNPDQANTRGLVCAGGTNPGTACTSDVQCLGGGTCSIKDARGDACDSTSADPDGDLVVDALDNCPDVYNPDQAGAGFCSGGTTPDSPCTINSDCLGDGATCVKSPIGTACDQAPDLVAVEAGSSQAEIFMGRQDMGFLSPSILPLGADPAGIVIGNFASTGSSPDDNPDLAVTDRASGTFQIFAGNGSGAFVRPFGGQEPSVPAGTSPGEVVAFDANPNDLDLDGVPNFQDNCPTRYNPDQADSNGDGIGDACSDVRADPDADGVPTFDWERRDNCPDTYNPDQKDTDGDGIGDACDINPTVSNPGDDNDGDGVPDLTDNCPTRYNPDQHDSSGTGVGDVCRVQTDDDRDGFPTAVKIRDNCPDTYNPDQVDLNFDGIGDACENVQDLAMVDEAANTVEVFVQFPPPGIWVSLPPIPVGNQPRSLVAVDLNADGYSDLVVSNAGDSTLTILMSQGDGTFASKACAAGSQQGWTCNTDADCPASACQPATVALPAPVLGLRGGFFRRDNVQNLPEVAGISPALNNPVILVNIIAERADVDNSNRVDGRDLAIWARGFGLVRGNPGFTSFSGADVNLDGKIDGLDLVYITTVFGKNVPFP